MQGRCHPCEVKNGSRTLCTSAVASLSMPHVWLALSHLRRAVFSSAVSQRVRACACARARGGVGGGGWGGVVVGVGVGVCVWVWVWVWVCVWVWVWVGVRVRVRVRVRVAQGAYAGERACGWVCVPTGVCV